VQLVGQGVAQWMVGNRWHETLPLLGQATLFREIVKFFVKIQYVGGIRLYTPQQISTTTAKGRHIGRPLHFVTGLPIR
jgi:hypothetical protein